MANQVWHSPYDASEIDGALATYSNVAQEYSSSSTYALNALCLHENILYKCTTAITTAEPWTAAHWTQTYMADYMRATHTGGDMLKSEYDPNEAVLTEGGIPQYVQNHAGSSEYKLTVSYPSTTYGEGTVPATAKKYAKVKSIIGDTIVSSGSLKDATITKVVGKDENDVVIGERKLPQAITVRSASDTVRDIYTPTTGIIERKVGTYTFTGNETYELENTNFCRIRVTSITTTSLYGEAMFAGLTTYYCYNDVINNDLSICISVSSGYLNVLSKNTNCSTSNDFKTFFTGKKINFELANPTQEHVAPINPFVEVEAEGTIGLVHTESPSAESRFETDFYTADNIDDVNGTVSNIPFSFGELLWQNASPSSSFSSQTVSVDLSKYSFVLVSHRMDNGYARMCNNIFKVGTTSALVGHFADTVNVYKRSTEATISSVIFGGGYKDSTSNNTVAIPCYIYGIK